MENYAKMELKWGRKLIKKLTLAVWDQILRRLNFDEFLKLEKSSKNRKKTEIWSSKGRGTGISLAYGNIPAPGLGQIRCMQK